MRKYILLHVTSSLKMGGAETVLYELIKGLGQNEFEHHVIYFHGGPWEVRLRELGIALHQVRGIVSLYDPVFFIRLYKTIKKINPHCIHSLLWAANVSSRIVAKLLSIPHVSVYHNNIDQDGFVRNWCDKKTRMLSVQIVAVSSEVADSLIKTDGRFSASALCVIRNGIDVAELLAQGNGQMVLREQLNLRVHDLVIGSVGRFCPVKRYPLLLECFAAVRSRMPRARLVLVGMGPDEAMLRSFARTLGVNDDVRFVVGQPAHGYFHLFDCFVQSSDKEGISMALLEAMAHAVPCVATCSGLEHSVLTHTIDGLLVKAGDAQELCDAVMHVATDRALAQRLGRAGRLTVESRFHSSRMIEAYRKLLISCCHF
jgi:glycosyltransferase involved in cell wall biosynthesis